MTGPVSFKREPHTRQRLPPWFFWATWLIGPANYAMALAYCLTWPEMCDDPPNMLLAFQMVITHLIAGGMTIALVVDAGPHRFTAEFWLLTLYWGGIAGWVIIPFLFMGAPSVEMDPTFPFVCTRVSAVVAVLIPLFGLARWVFRRRRLYKRV